MNIFLKFRKTKTRPGKIPAAGLLLFTLKIKRIYSSILKPLRLIHSLEFNKFLPLLIVFAHKSPDN